MSTSVTPFVGQDTSVDAARNVMVAWLNSLVADQNSKAVAAYIDQANAWTATATHSRELGLPIPAKPVPPLVAKLVPSNSDDPNVLPFQIALGPEFVCPIVTDLPPLPAPNPDNTIDIGVHLYGAFWQPGPKDTCPDGFKTQPMPAGKDYPAGSVFQKMVYFMTTKLRAGYWLKVS